MTSSKVSDILPGFEEREGQTAMLRDVQQAYEDETTVLIEAGTGIGKSFAYLIPSMQWALSEKEPTVIATNTIALQEQLVQKDIPFLLDELGYQLKAVLVKGMHNYVCLRKLNDAASDLPEILLNWVESTREGSRSELPIAASHELWEQVGAEAESCTNVKCPHYKECFFFKARKETSDAQLIVVNHHLLFADLAARSESDNYTEACILPPYRRLIIDEAHHIEDVATEYFADRVSRRGLVHLLGRLISDRNTGKLLTFRHKITKLDLPKILDAIDLTLPVEKRHLVDLIHRTFDEIRLMLTEEKLRVREHHLKQPQWLDKVQPSVEELVRVGKKFLQSVLLLEGQLPQENPCEGILADIRGICARLEEQFDNLHRFVFSPIESTRVRWIEEEGRLISADLEIAPRLKESLFDRIPTIVMCSATLATHGDFSFIRGRLGIDEAEERIYPSPFDYERQALLSIPVDLPDPNSKEFTEAAAEKIWEGIQASRGGVFVLFTSYAMLRECEQRLSERLSSKKYPFYCQGDEERSSLLNKFRSSRRAVLFGTDSFWEGVDVVGDALRCVIIVKLPFKVPNDPLFQARSEAIVQKGGSSFFDYSLPHAIVKFKQGFGRLIRNKEDRGCVVCLDSRLIKKNYGKLFLKSLPPCPQATTMDEIKDFFRARGQRVLQTERDLYRPQS